MYDCKRQICHNLAHLQSTRKAVDNLLIDLSQGKCDVAGVGWVAGIGSPSENKRGYGGSGGGGVIVLTSNGGKSCLSNYFSCTRYCRLAHPRFIILDGGSFKRINYVRYRIFAIHNGRLEWMIDLPGGRGWDWG